MKITIENQGKTTLHSIMFVLGYHQDGIKKAFKEYAKELN